MRKLISPNYPHLPLAFRSHSDKIFLPFFEKTKSWLLINCNRKSQTSLYRIMLLSSAKKNGKNMTILRKPPDQSSFILSSFKKREKRIYANHARFIQKKKKKKKKKRKRNMYFFLFLLPDLIYACPVCTAEEGGRGGGGGRGANGTGGIPIFNSSSASFLPSWRPRSTFTAAMSGIGRARRTARNQKATRMSP